MFKQQQKIQQQQQVRRLWLMQKSQPQENVLRLNHPQLLLRRLQKLLR